MALVSALRERLASMGKVPELERSKSQEELEAKREKMLTGKRERIFNVGVVAAKAMLFTLLKNVVQNNGFPIDPKYAVVDSVVHVGKGKGSEAVANVPLSKTDCHSIRYVCGVLKVPADAIIDHLENNPELSKVFGNIPPQKLDKPLALLLVLAFMRIVVHGFRHRRVQSTVTVHHIGSIKQLEEETLFDPGQHLAHELKEHGWDVVPAQSNDRLQSELSLSPEQLSELVAQYKALLLELKQNKGKRKGHGTGTRSAGRRKSSMPTTLRAAFLVRQSQADPKVLPLAADKAVGCSVDIDVHDTASSNAEEKKGSDAGSSAKSYAAIACNPRCSWCDGGCGTSHSITLRKRLGKGTSGIVYAAEYNDRPCAVKLFTANFSEDTSSSDLFLNELDIMNRIHSPYCVQLLGACITPPNYCMVMPLSSVGTLDRLLYKSKQELSTKVLLGIALDVARGLEYLHDSLHIVHRDVKPANVLLDGTLDAAAALSPSSGHGDHHGDKKTETPDDHATSNSDDVPASLTETNLRAQVSDFGTATRIRKNESIHNGLLIGTPVYMAPEIHRKLNYGFDVDTYAWAITTSEMLHGCEPFASEIDELGSWEPVVERVVQQGLRPARPNKCPDAVWDLLQQCWDEKRHKRPKMSEVVKVMTSVVQAMK